MQLPRWLSAITAFFHIHEEPFPEAAAGLLYSISDPAQPVFLGSCFAFGTTRTFLTADHCIRGVEARAIRVAYGIGEAVDKMLPIVMAYPHPDADLAVLVASRNDPRFTPYLEVIGAMPGEGAHAYGFPEETDSEGVGPTDRHFHGVVQRVTTYDEQKPYAYEAFELSFSVPPGLSGAPVYASANVPRVGEIISLFGLATGNREVSRQLSTVTDVREGSTHLIERIYSVTNHGIAIDLQHYEGWLTTTIGRASGA